MENIDRKESFNKNEFLEDLNAGMYGQFNKYALNGIEWRVNCIKNDSFSFENFQKVLLEELKNMNSLLNNPNTTPGNLVEKGDYSIPQARRQLSVLYERIFGEKPLFGKETDQDLHFSNAFSDFWEKLKNVFKKEE